MPSFTWTMFGCRASLSSEPLSNARQPLLRAARRKVGGAKQPHLAILHSRSKYLSMS